MNASRFAGILTIFLVITGIAAPVSAQTVKILHIFPRKFDPVPPVTLSGSYILYGIIDGEAGFQGGIYQLSYLGGTWDERTIHTFSGADGSAPFPGLIKGADGALYGVTMLGGKFNKGVVFKLAKSNGSWTETIIHNFGGTGDGSTPTSPLTKDKDGNLYGVAANDGTFGFGIAYELTMSDGVWTEKILHNFGGPNDAKTPEVSLIIDRFGNLFGLAFGGGSAGEGAVFELSSLNGIWTETVIYSFPGNLSIAPFVLLPGPNDVLYGATVLGGSNVCAYGCGTIFELRKNAKGNWVEKVLYDFGSVEHDGIQPHALLRDPKTNTLYGVAQFGGLQRYGCGGGGCGTIFELTQTNGVWSEKALFNFVGGAVGEGPTGLIRDSKTGIFYGINSNGHLRNIFQMIP